MAISYKVVLARYANVSCQYLKNIAPADNITPFRKERFSL